MEYKRFDNTIVARIDRGEEILEQLKTLSGMSSDALVEQRYRHFRDVKYFGEAKA